ncbi:unnamed protein product [marine sediment metagenome]|uniref:Uncharacterized protein n=1 Tax=marine sediment metagenome TaxID=412755 RepID=X0SQ81_9ZZZZ
MTDTKTGFTSWQLLKRERDTLSQAVERLDRLLTEAQIENDKLRQAVDALEKQSNCPYAHTHDILCTQCGWMKAINEVKQ